MKYVVFQVSLTDDHNLEIPVVFPGNLVHSIVTEDFINALQKHFPSKVIRPISAGFLSSMVFGGVMCHGDSESLKLNSRGPEDDALLIGLDYGSMHKC